MSRALAWVRSEPFYFTAACAYLLLLVISVAGTSPTNDVDTNAYRNTASCSLFSGCFWGGGRAWLTPLLFKIVHTDSLFVPAQMAVAAACWLALAVAVARSLGGKRLPRIGFGLVLMLGLSVNVVQWDSWLASEPLSLSLAALVVAGSLEIVRRPTWWWLAALALAAFAWASDRDSNAWVVLLVLGPVAIALIVLRFRRLGIVLLAAVAVIFSLTNLSANAQHRWDLYALDVLAARILPNAQATQFFVDSGMPLSPGLRKAAGKPTYTSSYLWTFYYANRPFQKWFLSNMQMTYIRFLLAHPRGTVSGPVHNLRPMLSPNVQEYRSAGLNLVLPSTVESIIYPWEQDSLIFATVVLAAFGLASALLRPSRLWLVPAIFGLSTIPHAVIVWNGEPGNIDKHSITLALIYRVILLLTFLFVLDTARARMAPRPAPSAPL